MKKLVFFLLCFAFIYLTNSSFASPASVLELLAKEAIKAVGGEIGKAAIEKFKDLFNSNKEIAKKGNPKLAHEPPLKNKEMWAISPGNLSRKDIEKLARILKSLDNDTDQVIKIKGSDNVVATTENGSVSFGTYQEIVGSSDVNSLNQQQTKTIISDSPNAIVNSPGATRIEIGKNTGDIQTEKESVSDLIKRFPVITEVIRGIKSCHELSPEAQAVCIKEDARLRLTAMVMSDPRFTAEQIISIMQQPTLSDMKKSIEVAISDKVVVKDEYKVFKNLKKITVDAKANASSDSENGWQRGKVVKLSAGTWQISGAGGGWSAWASNSQKDPRVKGAWTWNVYMRTSSDMFPSCYGVCDDWWQFDSPQEALKYVEINVNPYILRLDKLEKVYFWIRDTGDIPNNRGEVTLDIFQQD